ncbi:hypothetical protein VTL71DRAFT_5410 [Oculimacula yallundae]|uniref:Uncharacterized protein n=1 Tax=Oculimacula yallundae TaxID=86028 RepID=A0ABR4C158_9HELO
MLIRHPSPKVRWVKAGGSFRSTYGQDWQGISSLLTSIIARDVRRRARAPPRGPGHTTRIRAAKASFKTSPKLHRGKPTPWPMVDRAYCTARSRTRCTASNCRQDAAPFELELLLLLLVLIALQSFCFGETRSIKIAGSQRVRDSEEQCATAPDRGLWTGWLPIRLRGSQHTLLQGYHVRGLAYPLLSSPLSGFDTFETGETGERSLGSSRRLTE